MTVPALYTDKTLATGVVTEKISATPGDLEALLDSSSAQDPNGVLVYRPYFVAGKMLLAKRAHLESAEGAKFVDPRASAQEFILLQRNLDKVYNLDVPKGMEAILEKPYSTRAQPSGTIDTNGRW